MSNLFMAVRKSFKKSLKTFMKQLYFKELFLVKIIALTAALSIVLGLFNLIFMHRKISCILYCK